MAVKTPEEKALTDVEKAIKDYEKAVDKREAADAKANDARAAEHRALRTLEWTARHPDLADDFDLAAFQQSLEAPFDDEGDDDEGAGSPPGGDPFSGKVSDSVEDEANAVGDAIESGEIDPDELETDDDDPFGDGAGD